MNAAEMIGDAGFDVIEAGNADEATAILEARRESQQIAGPDKSKRKAHRVEAAGSRPLSAV